MKKVTGYSTAGIGRAAPARYPGVRWGRRFRMTLAFRIVAVTLRFAPACSADDAGGSAGGASSGTAVENYFAHGFDRVSKAQVEQPNWGTPLAIGTPRLEQFWPSWSRNQYMLSLLQGLAVPSGSEMYTTHQTLVTPALALGKGWGDFDFQGTTGIAPPVDLDGHWSGGENEKAAAALLDALAAGGSADAYRIA